MDWQRLSTNQQGAPPSYNHVGLVSNGGKLVQAALRRRLRCIFTCRTTAVKQGLLWPNWHNLSCRRFNRKASEIQTLSEK